MWFISRIFLVGIAMSCGILRVAADSAELTDAGWPRIFREGDQQLTVHQPQVDVWAGYTNLQFRCAIEVKTPERGETFGVAEVEAQTVTDHEARTVAIYGIKRVLRFPNVDDKELSNLNSIVDQIYPPGQATVVALERIVAYLDPESQPLQRPVKLKMNPPRIFTSSRPAILVSFMGKPQFRPVETNRTDLEFALNCSWDILYDTREQRFYLLNGDSWLTTSDLLKGTWNAAKNLPSSIHSLPKDQNWSDVSKHVPGNAITRVPTVFVTTEAAELILVDGPPRYTPIPGTKLQRVSNTQNVLFLDSADRRLYFLIAGRWFRGEGLSGPWEPASENLPEDFARIPDDDPSAFVKASVPGTSEAKDAVLLASIPKATVVSVTNQNVEVVYSGEPKFQKIGDTGVQYAVNSPTPVFLVDGKYYCCVEGCFFTSSGATGPWTVAPSIPPAIYTIPPSHPMHFVTYVAVSEATPETVTYIQTGGYGGEYVSPTGVVMFGSGESTSDEPTESSDPGYYYYWYEYPSYYSYGIGATYHYGYGGFYGVSYNAYGPYGGVGVFAGYNAYTGAYVRSAGATGFYRAASRTAAYNPNSGAMAARAEVITPHHTASRGAAYNPITGEGAVGARHSSQYGSAAAIKTTQRAAVAWDTQNSQGVVAKTASGNVYAAKDGTVYMRDANGNWWHNSGRGWQNTSRPQPVSTPANRQALANQQQAQAQVAAARQQQAARQDLERQAKARQSANRQTARVNNYRAYGKAAGRGVVIRGRR